MNRLLLKPILYQDEKKWGLYFEKNPEIQSILKTNFPQIRWSNSLKAWLLPYESKIKNELFQVLRSKIWIDYSQIKSEELRIKSEELRIKSEELRIESEELRIESEELRIKSEGLRIKSEELRIKSGELRIERGGLRIESGGLIDGKEKIRQILPELNENQIMSIKKFKNYLSVKRYASAWKYTPNKINVKLFVS